VDQGKSNGGRIVRDVAVEAEGIVQEVYRVGGLGGARRRRGMIAPSEQQNQQTEDQDD
jgi:hypothetical protein